VTYSNILPRKEVSAIFLTEYNMDGSIGVSLTYRELFDPVENFIRSLILYYISYPWNDSEVQEIFGHVRELYPICKYICIRGNLTHNNIRSLRELYPVCSYRIQLYPCESDAQQYPVLSGTLSSLVMNTAVSQEVKHTSISSPTELYPVCHT
jgi:hypothetical protein